MAALKLTMNRYLPVIFQALLAPITLYFVFVVFIFGGKSVSDLLIGLATFSAVFGGLSLSAYSARLDEESRRLFKKSSVEFLQATLLAALAVIFNFTRIWIADTDLPQFVGLFLAVGLGLCFGAGGIAAHMALWWFSKAVFHRF